MTSDASSEPNDRCISCDKVIGAHETSRQLHGFPIHGTCYERELGISKKRGGGGEDNS